MQRRLADRLGFGCRLIDPRQSGLLPEAPVHVDQRGLVPAEGRVRPQSRVEVPLHVGADPVVLLVDDAVDEVEVTLGRPSAQPTASKAAMNGTNFTIGMPGPLELVLVVSG